VGVGGGVLLMGWEREMEMER
jgi:hypothetical protein